MEIRAATPADAAPLAALHTHTWQVAYQGLVCEEALGRLSLSEAVGGWAERLQDLKPGETLVAEREGEIVGFVSFGPERVAREAGEIYALYVAPESWREGVGRALFERACEELRAKDYQQLVLWVLRGNQRAARFYERLGLRADGGEKPEEMAGETLRCQRYGMDL